MNENIIYTISEITGKIKQTLENDFPIVTVIGEISNFKNHSSGHWYFTLKDNNAALNCTMWKSNNYSVIFSPQDGMQIIAKGKITVYPPRGSYQLNVSSMLPAGEGALQAAFERLKKKLQREGLFDEKFKKPIPQFPRRIGIVTAGDGAAFRDMVTTANRRFPAVELVLASAKVQGAGAAEEIAHQIRRFNLLDDIDLIIIGRGGGSLEDLWAFNEEIVARAIFDSRIPIISGVGHEIDFSISDFVADLRAPTPTAAMELATPDIQKIFAFLKDFFYNASLNISQLIEGLKNKISQLIFSYGFQTTGDIINIKYQLLDALIYKMNVNANKKLELGKNNLDLLNAKIEAHDSERILQKGYAIIKQREKIIPRKKEFYSNKNFKIKFYDGEVEINNE